MNEKDIKMKIFEGYISSSKTLAKKLEREYIDKYSEESFEYLVISASLDAESILLESNILITDKNYKFYKEKLSLFIIIQKLNEKLYQEETPELIDFYASITSASLESKKLRKILK